METPSVNYFAIAVGAVLAMAIGAIWYGPLFGKKWLERALWIWAAFVIPTIQSEYLAASSENS